MPINTLFSGTLGQIIGCNLVDCIDLGLLDEKIVRKVLRKITDRCKADPPRNDRDVIGHFIRIVYERKLFYRSRRNPASVRHRTVCARRTFVTVIPRWHFVKIFRPTILTLRLNYIDRTGLHYPDASFSDIEALNGHNNIFKADATIGYKEPLWLADTNDLHYTKRRASTHYPDRIRDLLGLVHRGASEPLMLVEVTGHVVSRPKRPCAFDAGDHRRYRARSDHETVRPRININYPYDHEGYTVDLKRFCHTKNRNRLNGVREYVCQPIPMPAPTGVRWTRLGVTTTNAEPGSEGAMNKRFLAYLLRGRSIDRIRKRLERLSAAAP
jgi:hypothetical protein